MAISWKGYQGGFTVPEPIYNHNFFSSLLLAVFLCSVLRMLPPSCESTVCLQKSMVRKPAPERIAHGFCGRRLCYAVHSEQLLEDSLISVTFTVCFFNVVICHCLLLALVPIPYWSYIISLCRLTMTCSSYRF